MLHFLWAVFKERHSGFLHLSHHPGQLTSLIKDSWIAVKKSPVDNPIDKISVAVQQLGNQLEIFLSFTIQGKLGAVASQQHLWDRHKSQYSNEGAAEEGDGGAITQG